MTQRVRKDGRESVPSPPANRRRQCLSTMLLIVAVTGGAMAGWIAGRRHVQTMLNDVDDLGETIVVSFFHEGHDRNGGWGSSLVLIEGDHMLYLPGSYGTYSTGTASYSNNVINGVEIIGNKEYLFEGTIIPKEYNLRYLYLNVTKIRELN